MWVSICPTAFCHSAPFGDLEQDLKAIHSTKLDLLLLLKHPCVDRGHFWLLAYQWQWLPNPQWHKVYRFHCDKWSRSRDTCYLFHLLGKRVLRFFVLFIGTVPFRFWWYASWWYAFRWCSWMLKIPISIHVSDDYVISDSILLSCL